MATGADGFAATSLHRHRRHSRLLPEIGDRSHKFLGKEKNKNHPHCSNIITSGGAMASRARVAVIGSGISGSVCASLLAAKGVSVTLFESGRAPGGRMAQRRDLTQDGKELFFDHGAPFFTVKDIEVLGLVKSWEAHGFVARWNEKFATFDQKTSQFMDFDQESNEKYVGVPGMNSVCKALSCQPGVEAIFGITVGSIRWMKDRNLWLLADLEGQSLGDFYGVVASDKNVISSRFTARVGRPPPLDLTVLPALAKKMQHIPVHPRFVAMLAFSEPLCSIPVKGFSYRNSDVLSWAFCDSSKPGRSSLCPVECWVLHSTAEYAAAIIERTGLKKLSDNTLAEIAEELLEVFAGTAINIPRPIYAKAHRWGSAFPAIYVGGEDKCLVDKGKRLVICGDFCASGSVEGAVLSGMRAASMLLEVNCCL